MSVAIRKVSQGLHDPFAAHEKIKTFYDWSQVTQRTEKVYDMVMKSPHRDLSERLQR